MGAVLRTQLKDGHWSCEQRTETFSTSSSRSDIYRFPWAGGSSTLLGSIAGQSIAWLGVAEDGEQLVVASGSLTSTGAITGCSVSWRNPVTLAPLSQAIPNALACQGGRGSGGISPSIQVVQQGLLDN